MNEVGKFLRKMRIDRGGTSLREMATQLGVSSSLLSSYETGRRSIPDPDEFISKVALSTEMNSEETSQFRQAVYQTVESYKMDLTGIDPTVREQYIEFARTLPSLTPEDLGKLFEKQKDG